MRTRPFTGNMVGSFGIPLSWANLTHNRLRLFGALMGISFAVNLMFVQMGFYNALFDAQNQLLDRLRADFVITSQSKFCLVGPAPLPRSRLFQARSVAGVTGVYPLYVEYVLGVWKDEESRNLRPIRIVAIDPDDPILDIPEIALRREALRSTEEVNVLIDRRGKPCFGRKVPGAPAELTLHKASIVGTFDLGADFRAEGTAIVNVKHFAKIFSGNLSTASRSRVELVAVQLEPGADRAKVRAALEAALPPDVAVRTKDEVCAMERAYWKECSPIATVFTLGILVGFIVGVMICYQTLYTEVVDYMDQFATLKAIGYSDRSVLSVVMEEAVFYAFLGYVIGLAQALVIYTVVEGMTGLPMRLSLFRLALIFVLTVGMCAIAGAIAVRKVASADPADVF